MDLTNAQVAAIAMAVRSNGAVYAGWNPGSRTPVNGSTIRALARAGLMTVSKTTVGEMVGTLTRAGWDVARGGRS